MWGWDHSEANGRRKSAVLAALNWTLPQYTIQNKQHGKTLIFQANSVCAFSTGSGNRNISSSMKASAVPGLALNTIPNPYLDALSPEPPDQSFNVMSGWELHPGALTSLLQHSHTLCNIRLLWSSGFTLFRLRSPYPARTSNGVSHSTATAHTWQGAPTSIIPHFIWGSPMPPRVLPNNVCVPQGTGTGMGRSTKNAVLVPVFSLQTLKVLG